MIISDQYKYVIFITRYYRKNVLHSRFCVSCDKSNVVIYVHKECFFAILLLFSFVPIKIPLNQYYYFLIVIRKFSCKEFVTIL